MEAACASSSILQRDLLVRLQKRNNVIGTASLHGAKNSAFRGLGEFTVNRKHRFMVIRMSYDNSYAVPQSHGAGGARSFSDGEISGGGELARVLNLDEVMEEAEITGVSLPLDLLEAAKSTGIPRMFLRRYLYMQGLGWGLGFAMRSCSMFRNQMMTDPSYLFTLGNKFALDVFVDVLVAIVMKSCGINFMQIVNYLMIQLVVKVVRTPPFSAGTRQQTNANGSAPPPNSMFEPERCKQFSLAAYYCGVMFYTGLMIAVLYGKK